MKQFSPDEFPSPLISSPLPWSEILQSNFSSGDVMFRRHKGCRHIGCLNCRQPIQNGNVCWCDQLPCHTVQGSYASTGVIRQLISYYMVTIQSIWWIYVHIESSCTSYDIGWLSKVLDESLEQSKHPILLSRYPFCNGSTYHCSRADARQEMLLLQSLPVS